MQPLQARAPHSTLEWEFRLWAIFCVSTNTKVKFSKVDGGVARRANCVPWNWEFAKKVTRPDEQKLAANEDIKESAWLKPHIPGLLYLLVEFKKVYWANGGGGLGVKPAEVIEATEDMLAIENSGALLEFAENQMTVVERARDASTKTSVMQALRAISGFTSQEMVNKVFEKSVENVLVFLTRDGSRERCREAAGQRRWLKLNQ